MLKMLKITTASRCLFISDEVIDRNEVNGQPEEGACNPAPPCIGEADTTNVCQCEQAQRQFGTQCCRS